MATEDFRRIFESLRIPVAGAGPTAQSPSPMRPSPSSWARADRGLPGTEFALLFAAADRKRLLQVSPGVGEGKIRRGLDRGAPRARRVRAGRASRCNPGSTPATTPRA